MESVADSQMSGGSVVLRIDEDIGGVKAKEGQFFLYFNLNSWYYVHTWYAY